ncbi:hypothetical protein ABS768_14720 [Flavobacterium sp. ST-75]|uniref:Lipoprotein n=1 Tax=Flavobacterium rhizophilum TaxID=3163296 RepID=A0ABW8YHI2_9FLAO
MKKIIFILFVILGSCKEAKHTDEKDVTYYTTEAIQEKNEREYLVKLKEFRDKDSGGIEPVLIPYFYDDQFYSNHNFIIDSLNNIYYHYRLESYISVICATGLAEGPFPAPYIQLQPERIIDVTDNIETFLKSRVMDSIKNEEETYIFIGSQKDSFQSPAIDKLFLNFNPDYRNRFILCRRTTEEENIVLQYKKSGEPYNPDTIKWNPDLTAIQK